MIGIQSYSVPTPVPSPLFISHHQCPQFPFFHLPLTVSLYRRYFSSLLLFPLSFFCSFFPSLGIMVQQYRDRRFIHLPAFSTQLLYRKMWLFKLFPMRLAYKNSPIINFLIRLNSLASSQNWREVLCFPRVNIESGAQPNHSMHIFNTLCVGGLVSWALKGLDPRRGFSPRGVNTLLRVESLPLNLCLFTVIPKECGWNCF